MGVKGHLARCAALLIIATTIASCEIPAATKNIGTGVMASRGPVVVVSVPAGMVGGQDSTWSASWIGGTAPYTINWNFGGGAANIGPIVASSPDSQTVTMLNPSLTDSANYTYTVTVRDSLGLESSATGSYSLGMTLNSPDDDLQDYEPGLGGGPGSPGSPGGTPQPNRAPEITGVSLAGPFMSVELFDPDGGKLVAHVAEWTGAEPVWINDSVYSEGIVRIKWIVEDVYVGGSGTATLVVTDPKGATDVEYVTFSIKPYSHTIEFEPDTIYVLPSEQRVSVGEPVRFFCGTGRMPNPFQFMNGMGVVVEEDAEYVKQSFNVGDIGGEQDEPDGSIWLEVGPTGYLLADGLIQSVPSRWNYNSIPDGRERWEFNATGLHGIDILDGEGMLFNFEFTFSKPGLKRVGLQAVDGVNRTYYSDGSSTEYFWGTLMADEHGNLNVTGVDNTVLVEE